MAKRNLIEMYSDRTVGNLNNQLLEMARNKTVNYDICPMDEIIKQRLAVEEVAEKELVGFEFNRSIHKQFEERYVLLRKHREQYLIDIGKMNSQLEEDDFKQQQDMRQLFKDANTTQFLIGKIEQLKHLTIVYENYKDTLEHVVEMLGPINDFMTSACNALAISSPMNLITRYTALQEIFKENVASRHAIMFKVDHLKAKLRSRMEFHDAQLLRLYETINKLVVDSIKVALKNRDDESALETRLQSSSVEETMRFNTNNAIRNIYEKITSHSTGSKFTRTDDPFEQVKIIHNGFKTLMDVADIVYKKELAAVKKVNTAGSAKTSKTATDLQKEVEKMSVDLQEKSFSIAQPQPPHPKNDKKRGRGNGSIDPQNRRKGMLLTTYGKSTSNIDIPKTEKTAPKHYQVHKRHTLPQHLADIAHIILPICKSSTRATNASPNIQPKDVSSLPKVDKSQPTDDSGLPKVNKKLGKKRFITASRKVKHQLNKQTQNQEYSDLLELKDDQGKKSPVGNIADLLELKDDKGKKSAVGKITFENRKDSEGSQDQQKAETSKRKQTSVGRRQTTVDKRPSFLDRRQTNVDRRQTTFDRRQTIVDKHQTDVSRRQTTVERRQTTVERRQTTVDKCQTDVSRRQTTFDRRKTVVDKRQTDVSRRQTDVSRRQTTVDKPQTDVSRRQTTVDRRDFYC